MVTVLVFLMTGR